MNNDVYVVCNDCYCYRKFYLPLLSGLIKKEVKEFLMRHWDCEVRLMDKRGLYQTLNESEDKSLWEEQD